MFRPILAIICVSLLLSGCVGFGVASIQECKNERPSTDYHVMFTSGKNAHDKKEDFLKEWGNPDEIITEAENKEIWVYNTRRWCGVIPILIVPIPLLLPVCDGFDRITFQGDTARSLHTKRTGGSMLLIFPHAVAESTCVREVSAEN